ncbi:MAG TPA: ATP-binding protein [Dongiaceae bacterium]|nr:ATP-binding protein [Dongiaceae bacterium]
MTIKRRLILLLLPLSAAILVMALGGGWALYRADLGATRIYHERVVTMRNLTIISDLYDDTIHNAAQRFVSGRDGLGDTMTVIAAARNRAFALWLQHRSTPMGGVARQLSQEIEASMRDIDLDIDALKASQAEAAGTAGTRVADSLAPSSRITVNVEPRLDRLSRLFSSLADQELSSAEADYLLAHRYFGWGLLGVLAAALASVAGLGLVVMIIIRHVTRPLGEALLADSEVLLHGTSLPDTTPPGAMLAGTTLPGTAPHGTTDVTAAPPPQRYHDEISAVVETLRRFRRNLHDLATLKEEQAHQANVFRAQLEAIFRHAPVGVYMKDIEGHMLVVSDAAAQLWGHSHDEMIGKLDTSWSKPDEAAIIQATNRQVLETGMPVTIEYRGQAPNTYDWMLTVKFPVRDEAGRIISIGGVDMDISGSKRQIEDLRLASAHLQNVKRLARMYYWSRRVDAVTGATKHYHVDAEFSELTGRDDLSEDALTYANQVIHPDDRAQMIAIYADFEAGKFDDYQVEYRILRPDARILHVRAWVERMRDVTTGDILIAGVVKDISGEKQREAQLLAAKAEAEASDRAKSEFLTNMSHELRTPLNAVIGYSDLLRLNSLVQGDAQLASYVDAVNESGRSLLEIINAILDMSRLESSDLNLQEIVFPLSEAVAEIERLTRVRAEGKDIALHFPRIGETAAGIDGDLLDADLKIRAEPRAFRQILMNVLSNAVKFTGSGGSVTLSLALRHNGDLAIEVRDTGIGMDANLVRLLTIPFIQAGSAWTRRKGGIGLGLAIAKKLLDLHQGRFEVESRPGTGTRVALTFPAARLHWPRPADGGGLETKAAEPPRPQAQSY